MSSGTMCVLMFEICGAEASRSVDAPESHFRQMFSLKKDMQLSFWNHHTHTHVCYYSSNTYLLVILQQQYCFSTVSSTQDLIFWITGLKAVKMTRTVVCKSPNKNVPAVSVAWHEIP